MRHPVRLQTGVFRLALVAAALLCGRASGQAVRGRVVDAGNQQPIAGALVELRDLAGKPLQTALTSASGRFVLNAPSAADYLYRVAAIGYSARPPARISVSAGGISLGDVRLTRAAIRVEDIVAVGRGKVCGAKSVADDLFGRMLESAHTALDIMDATIRTRQVSFEAEIITTRTILDSVMGDTVRSVWYRWPIESIDPDTLRLVGFGRITGDNIRLFGPDPRVLFSEWFMATHCFALARVDPRRDTLHIEFTPVARSTRVDIAGDLALDAGDLALLGFSFHAQNLPTPDKAFGGEMHFTRLVSGLWLPTTWSIWGPIRGVGGCAAVIVGLTEHRGTTLKALIADSGGTGTSTVILPGVPLPRRTTYDKAKCILPSTGPGGGATRAPPESP